jgi:hypothetical protein
VSEITGPQASGEVGRVGRDLVRDSLLFTIGLGTPPIPSQLSGSCRRKVPPYPPASL